MDEYFTCKGVMLSDLKPWLFDLCNSNLKDFLKESSKVNYCPYLVTLLNKSVSLMENYTILGFLIPKRSNNSKKCALQQSIITPSALLFTFNNSLDKFFMKSYLCEIENKYNRNGRYICNNCATFWRSFRGKSPSDTITIKEHKKILKFNEKKEKINNEEKNDLKVEIKKQKLESNKIINRLIKKSSYWRLKCKNIGKSVEEWRKKEDETQGFLKIKVDEAKMWILFYDFINELIDKEHPNDPELASLHKELIRTETYSLGKFNKNNQKTGIKSKKISSKILNYSLTLANALGKTKYETEAALRSLPCWTTLTR